MERKVVAVGRASKETAMTAKYSREMLHATGAFPAWRQAKKGW